MDREVKKSRGQDGKSADEGHDYRHAHARQRITISERTSCSSFFRHPHMHPHRNSQVHSLSANLKQSCF